MVSKAIEEGLNPPNKLFKLGRTIRVSKGITVGAKSPRTFVNAGKLNASNALNVDGLKLPLQFTYRGNDIVTHAAMLLGVKPYDVTRLRHDNVVIPEPPVTVNEPLHSVTFGRPKVLKLEMPSEMAPLINVNAGNEND